MILRSQGAVMELMSPLTKALQIYAECSCYSSIPIEFSKFDRVSLIHCNIVLSIRNGNPPSSSSPVIIQHQSNKLNYSITYHCSHYIYLRMNRNSYRHILTYDKSTNMISIIMWYGFVIWVFLNTKGIYCCYFTIVISV